MLVYDVRQCAHCGKDVEICHKDRLNRKHIFCSKKCEGAYRRSHNPNWIPCAVCGKIVYKKPREQKSGNPLCCSYKCLGELRKGLIGEKNPNYGNRGSKNPNWKSDTKVSPYGYILTRCENHPYANCDGFVFEHRLVAERFLLTEENSIVIDGKRYLKREFAVHHKDHNKKNNHPDNLLVLTKSEHMKLHFKERRQLASENPVKSVKPKE